MRLVKPLGTARGFLNTGVHSEMQVQCTVYIILCIVLNAVECRVKCILHSTMYILCMYLGRKVAH